VATYRHSRRAMICGRQCARHGGVEVADVPNDHGNGRRPLRVLLVYYTYTGQSLRVLEAAEEVFRERGCEVHKARIEFTDSRFAERFARFPMRHVWRDMFSVLPAQRRRLSGEIRTPAEVRTGDYDFVCIGSPTWWRDASMPVRSFLASEEAKTVLSGKYFAVFVVCRRYWRENMATVRELGAGQGGRFLDWAPVCTDGDIWECAFRPRMFNHSNWMKREYSRVNSLMNYSAKRWQRVRGRRSSPMSR
jgi:menaquinone-dependent protoporphyrinogen IX oxidase